MIIASSYGRDDSYIDGRNYYEFVLIMQSDRRTRAAARHVKLRPRLRCVPRHGSARASPIGKGVQTAFRQGTTVAVPPGQGRQRIGASRVRLVVVSGLMLSFQGF